MEIKILKVGPLETNCYVLSKNDEVLVIDPGDDADFIKEHLIGDFMGILLTHRHFDHTGAIKELLNDYDIDIFSKDKFDTEKEYEIGSFKFTVIFTPGHTKDSVSYYFKDENVLFSGDFLFKGDVGRVDLPGGSEDEMIQSLKKLKTFNEDTVVYPGHGDYSTMKEECENNYYLKEYGLK